MGRIRILKAGLIYKEFDSKNGKHVVLRAIRWEDLDGIIEFANSLLDDRDADPDFGILFEQRPTRESEAAWLGKKLAEIESGKQVSAVAECEGKIIGNSEVSRGAFSDEYCHGTLGISVVREFRNQGIGLEMMKTLIEESRKAGLKTIELEVFATNPGAIHMYQSAGFKEVGRIPKKIFRKGHFTDIVVMAIEL